MRTGLVFSSWLIVLMLTAAPRAQVDGNTEIAEMMNAYAAFKMADYDKALSIWRPLAERGNTNAMNQIAGMYEQGQGVEQDLTEGAAWRRRAAEAGDAVGQLYLGLAYETGRGVAQDNQRAAFWFRKAAEQGDADAQFNLGIMLATAYGQGAAAASPEQKAEAVKWLEAAAKGGKAEAAQFVQMLK